MNSTPSITNIDRRVRMLASGIALAAVAFTTSCGSRTMTAEDFSKPSDMTRAVAESAVEALKGMGVASGSRLIVWSALPAEQESVLNAFREKAKSENLEIVRVDVSAAAAERGGVELAAIAGDGGLSDWLGRVEAADALVLFSPPAVSQLPEAMNTKRPKILIVGLEFNESPALVKAGLADAAVISNPTAVAPEGKVSRQQLKDFIQVVTKP